MEPCQVAKSNGNCYVEDGNEEDESDMDMVNWEQLEEELFASRNQKKTKGSRLLTCLNLREEIRRQLAAKDEEDMANKSNTAKLRKSKSGFLDESSSSDSEPENEEMVSVPLTDESTTSTEDANDDKEFYLNHEFLSKITLRKATSSPNSEVMVQSRPNLKTRIQNQKDLQICFLSDFPSSAAGCVCVAPGSSASPSVSATAVPVLVPLASSGRSSAEINSKGPALLRQDFWSPPAEPSACKRNDTFSLAGSCLNTIPKSQSMFEMETEKQKRDKLILTHFDQTEAKWKQELQCKIHQLHQHIHLQMQRQRRRRKKSPICSKVALPYGKTRLDRSFLSDMNITHLQIILNDLHSQIETLNEELVHYLEERDELHMEQDSKLVDIDDLSRRLKELWIMAYHTKDKDLARPLHISALFTRKKGIANGFPNGSNEEHTHSSATGSVSLEEVTTPTTPTSTNGGLSNFRQKIMSFLP